MLVLHLPVLREVELALVWTVHTLFEYAQFPLLENQFVPSIHKYYFRQDPICIHVWGSRILSLRAIVPLFFQIWSWSDNCLTVGYICAFVTSSWRVSPYLLKLTVHLKTNFLFCVTSMQQARTRFSLLKVQWWSQRIPGVLVVNLSIWVLRSRQGCWLSWHSSPGRKKLLPQSLQPMFFLKVPRPLTRDFSAILPCLAYSWYKFHEDPDCADISPWSSNWSRLDCSHLVMVWSISIRWESIITVNSWTLLLSDSASSSCFWISDLTSARICSFFFFQGESWFACFPGRDLISVFETKLNLVRTRVSPYLFVWKKDWAGDKLSSWEW